MSDNLFKLGPLKVGLDGVLTWIPGVGDVYGLGASGFLLVQAARAGASNETLTKMVLLLGTDAVVGSVPLAGDVFDLVFRAHARAARVLLNDIKKRRAAIPISPPAATRPEPPRSEPPRPEQPSPPPPRSDPEPPLSEADEWEQARRVEDLRAQVKERGGSILRPRP